MDTKALINAVFNRRPIWDITHEQFTKSQVVEQCWKEIVAELGVKENKLKKKWKHLKELFSKELDKHTALQLADISNARVSKWIYFNDLIFLKEVVAASNLFEQYHFAPIANSGRIDSEDSSNINNKKRPMEQDNCIEQIDLTEDINKNEAFENKLEKSEDSTPAQSNIVSEMKRMKTETRIPDILKVCNVLNVPERSNVPNVPYGHNEAHFIEHSDDYNEDLLFFQSLLPHVRKIPASKKLSYRCRIQQLTEHYAYQK